MARRPDPIALALARRRVALGLSQEQVATRIGRPGNASTISAWEAGKRCPSVAAVRRWADALGCDLSLTVREANGG